NERTIASSTGPNRSATQKAITGSPPMKNRLLNSGMAPGAGVLVSGRAVVICPRTVPRSRDDAARMRGPECAEPSRDALRDGDVPVQVVARAAAAFVLYELAATGDEGDPLLVRGAIGGPDEVAHRDGVDLVALRAEDL